MTAALLARPAPETTDQTTPVTCTRCDRHLGLRAPGRYWMQQNKRTILVEGRRVTVWCERCGKQNDVGLE